MRIIYRLSSESLNDVAEEARWAEAAGYDGLHSSEQAHDPFFPLLLAAGATSKVTLETRVAIAFPRSPMVVAYAARDLQEFSGGRFRLGLGTQVKGHNERRFSVPWVSPGPRLREYVQAVHAIWANWRDGRPLDYRGQFYTFTLMPPAFNPGSSPLSDPPVYVGAINPYNCRVAGQLCGGLALHPLSSDKHIREVVAPNVATGARRAGRDPKDIALSGSPFIITGPDKSAFGEQKERIKRRIAFYASTRTYFSVLELHGFEELGPRLHRLSLEGKWDEMGCLVSDEVLGTFAVIGEYDEIAGKLKDRAGDILDELSFSMDMSVAGSQEALKKIIEDLKA